MAIRPGFWKKSYGSLWPNSYLSEIFCKVGSSPPERFRIIEVSVRAVSHSPSRPSPLLPSRPERFEVGIESGNHVFIHGGTVTVPENTVYRFPVPIDIDMGELSDGEEVRVMVRRMEADPDGERKDVTVEISYTHSDSDGKDPERSEMMGFVADTVDEKVEKLFADWAAGPWKEV